MKEKKRYILVQADGLPADEKALKTAAYEAAFEWLGDKGVSDARVQFVRGEAGKAEFWLKCSTKGLEDVVAALALKRFFQGKDVALRVVRVAGSVPRLEGVPRRPGKPKNERLKSRPA